MDMLSVGFGGALMLTAEDRPGAEEGFVSRTSRTPPTTTTTLTPLPGNGDESISTSEWSE